MGSSAYLCLAAVGVDSVIISLAFIIVTALYVTGNSDCKNIAYHAKSIKELVHYDILAVDNSVNGGRHWIRRMLMANLPQLSVMAERKFS